MNALLRTTSLLAFLTLSAFAAGCETDEKGGGGADGGGDGADGGDGGDGGGDGADGGDCPDADSDGVCDDDDLCEGDDATGDIDEDGDCNDVDTDDDGDGCADDIDADALVASTDDDGDGVAEDCDLCTGDDSTTDLDEDGECNDVDTDDDGDGCADDIDADALVASTDDDGDGVAEDCDLCTGDDSTTDLDEDGECNDIDTDDDADGCTDDVDADPLVGSTDDDGDGVAEDCDLCTGDDSTTDLDEDGECNDLDTDDDGDGCTDDVDGDPLTADADTDLDGVGDSCDICNGDDAIGDTDEDGDCDDIDTDDDDDGCEDSIDAAPLVASVDLDGDGSASDCDLCVGDDTTGDTDADGTCDDGDGDIDGDGCINLIDDDPLVAGTDSDTDGTADTCDYCPADATLICAMWTLPAYDSTYAYVNTISFESMFELTAAESTGVETISGFNGASVDPISGDIYVIARYSSTTARSLATFDPETGLTTTVGSMGDQFAGITFDSAGTLYGITGDGATTQETLYTIDPLTGTPTVLLTLGNGNDGEAIAHNPDNGLLYHASGLGSGTEKFESIDPSTLLVTDIPYDTDNRSEIFGLAWDPVTSSVLSMDISGVFTDITTTGVSTNLGTLSGVTSDDMRGLILLDQ